MNQPAPTTVSVQQLRIGTLGVCAIGEAVARLWTRAALRPLLSRRQPHRLDVLAAVELDTSVKSPREIAETRDAALWPSTLWPSTTGPGFVPFDTGPYRDAAERKLEGTPAWHQRLTYKQAARLFPWAPGAEAIHLAKGADK